MPSRLLHRLEAWALQRRAARRQALVRLAELLRSGRADPEPLLSLCIELGLMGRARQLLAENPRPLGLPIALQLAWLEGDFATLDRLAADPASPAALARAPQDVQNKCLVVLAQRSPAAALAWLRALPRPPLCAPAIALRAGAIDTAHAWRHGLRWRLHADYLLLDANQASGSTDRLALLNRYLGRHGLAPLRLIDAGRPLGVANLVGRQASPASAAPEAAAVSVVIPAHDNATHVRASIDSMLRQTHAPAEVLVIDDASRDATAEIVEAMARVHVAVRLIRLDGNRGAYFARNVGLAAARGQFVAFQDADDFAHPQRLERALAPLLHDARIHATTSRCVRLSDDGLFGETRPWPLTRWTPISLVMRREVALERVGFFEDMRFGADSEYVARLRLLLGERQHRLVPQPLALFGQRAGSLTTAGEAGFDAQGRSAPRIAYQEAWTERHLASLLGTGELRRSMPDEIAHRLAEGGAGDAAGWRGR